MFLDEAVVEFSSGKGGAGAATFHREKFVPRGGPNGADGGRGGDIVLVADPAKRTLYDFKLQRSFQAERGADASGNKSGKNGKDLVIHVPVGTVVIDDESGETVADLSVPEARVVICRGGRGGFGNLHFTSSVRQAPTFAQKGAPGEMLRARLELKMLADVGLIGLPNAGKSTLISHISAAKPKIADYPFTTLVPNLGVVAYHDETFVVADMPGLIEGAHEGHGLGDRFLKHIERTRVLVHVVDVVPLDESNPRENYDVIENELRQYSLDVAARPRLIALNKIDAVSPEALAEIRASFHNVPYPLFPISAVTGKGVDSLVAAMVETLKAHPAPAVPASLVVPMARPEDLNWDVEVEDDGYVVTGKRIERMVEMTDTNNTEALRYLHRRLTRLGVIERLREAGATEGDPVRIGQRVFEFWETE
ncbi:MAG: GTPase ObgE [Fimbriimonadaceae bacterium]